MDVPAAGSEQIEDSKDTEEKRNTEEMTELEETEGAAASEGAAEPEKVYSNVMNIMDQNRLKKRIRFYMSCMQSRV